MLLLPPDILAEMKASIGRIERQTTGQIVVVLAEESGKYLPYRLLPALWFALIFPIFVVFDAIPLSPQIAYSIQLLIVFVLGNALMILPVGVRFVPSLVKKRTCSYTAHQQFRLRGLNALESRAGILLFVSFEERYAEIIADAAISSRVEQAVWDGIVQTFTEQVRREHVTQGFAAAIEACGSLLIEHFPRNGGPDEEDLPNHLILI